jgi:hypothetical protein
MRTDGRTDDHTDRQMDSRKTDRQTDRQTDMTKSVVPFHNFSKAPKYVSWDAA